jgi:hypothetical protein
MAGLIFDANGNLFGTTELGGANGGGTVFEIVKTASGYASTPTTLASFCALANCVDGKNPHAGLIIDGNGNLFGTTSAGEPDNFSGTPTVASTVFEIAKAANGYASTPTTLVSFLISCHLGGGPAGFACIAPNGAFPLDGLIFDADGNLFGTTSLSIDTDLAGGPGGVRL